MTVISMPLAGGFMYGLCFKNKQPVKINNCAYYPNFRLKKKKNEFFFDMILFCQNFKLDIKKNNG